MYNYTTILLIGKNIFKSIGVYKELNFNISNTDISNMMNMSKSFASHNHFLFKYFTLDISKSWIS